MAAQIVDEKLQVQNSRFDTLDAKIDAVNCNLNDLRFSMKESIDALRWTVGVLLLPIYAAIIAFYLKN